MKNGVFCPENPDADGDGEVLSGDSAEGVNAEVCAAGLLPDMVSYYVFLL